MADALRLIASPAFKCAAEQPYNSLLYTALRPLGVETAEFSVRRALSGGYAIWHLHWPEATWNRASRAFAAVRARALLSLIDYLKLKGTRIVWTIHNLQAHESRYPWVENWFWRCYASRIDGYISLSEMGRAAALERYPSLRRVPGFVIPHGTYRGSYRDDLTRKEARARLGIPESARVVTFFGQIHPYKNVQRLVETFRALPDPDAHLIIAGRPADGEIEERVRSAGAGDPRVHLVLGFIPSDEVQTYFRACDLVVLPYREILNSGAAILALSFSTPLLVPRRGAMGELQERIGAHWVRTYPDDLSPRVLQDALHWCSRVPREAVLRLESMSWAEIALQTLGAYREVLSSSRQAAAEPKAALAHAGRDTDTDGYDG